MLLNILRLDFTIPASIFALGDILTPALEVHFGNESFPATLLLGIKAVLNTTKLQQSVLDCVAGGPCALGRLLGVVCLCPSQSPILLEP